MTGWRFGDLQINPEFGATLGFDSAPDGTAPASAVLRAAPAVTVADPVLGFAGFAGATAASFPQNPAQNTAGTAVAIGEAAVMAGDTLDLATAQVTTAETAFALNPAAPAKPVTFTVDDLRAGGKIVFGLLAVQPEIAFTHDRFASLPAQDSTDARETLTASIAPDGMASLVLHAGANQSRYGDGRFDADTDELLAGVQLAAQGLWNLQLLGGAARRRPAAGEALTAPVLEAALDWLPDAMDQVRFNAARAIDDPDEISPVPYTLTRAALSLRHDDLNSLVLHLATQVSDAAYMRSPLHETLFSADLGLDWRFNPACTLTADYTFNGRQANYLRANNAHAVTIGLTWTP